MFSVFPNPYSSNGPLVSHFFTLGSAMYILVLGGIQIAGKCPPFCVNFQHFLMQFIYDFSKDGAKRRRRREGRVRWRGWVSPQNKTFLFPRWISTGAFRRLLAGRKHGQSLEALRHGFYGSIAKRSLHKQCRNYPNNSRSDQGGGAIAPSPPGYATVIRRDTPKPCQPVQRSFPIHHLRFCLT